VRHGQLARLHRMLEVMKAAGPTSMSIEAGRRLRGVSALSSVAGEIQVSRGHFRIVKKVPRVTQIGFRPW
jgi:hypothetical protein